MNRPKPQASAGSKRAVAIVFVSVMGSALLVALVLGYFLGWCPRFAHGSRSDAEQITSLALADSHRPDAPNVYIIRNHALVAWSMLADGTRQEELFERRFCRWRFVTKADNGFQREDLRARGVPTRDSDELYARLMEGYAEGP
jgi:hypothetical protein